MSEVLCKVAKAAEGCGYCGSDVLIWLCMEDMEGEERCCC